MHLDLCQDQLREFLLNIIGQVFISTARYVLPLSGLCSESAVRAWQDELHEIRVVQLAIEIWVEKFDQVVAVCLSDTAGETIVSDEVKKIARRQKPSLISVKSLESRVRLKVLVLCQVLPLQLYFLLVPGSDEQEVSKQQNLFFLHHIISHPSLGGCVPLPVTHIGRLF